MLLFHWKTDFNLKYIKTVQVHVPIIEHSRLCNSRRRLVNYKTEACSIFVGSDSWIITTVSGNQLSTAAIFYAVSAGPFSSCNYHRMISVIRQKRCYSILAYIIISFFCSCCQPSFYQCDCGLCTTTHWKHAGDLIIRNCTHRDF